MAYPKKDGSDSKMSILSAIQMYSALIKDGKIKPDGAAANRMYELQKRRNAGVKFFRDDLWLMH